MYNIYVSCVRGDLCGTRNAPLHTSFLRVIRFEDFKVWRKYLVRRCIKRVSTKWSVPSSRNFGIQIKIRGLFYGGRGKNRKSHAKKAA